MRACGALCEDPVVTVLVLEAGGTLRQAHVRVPASFSKLFKTAADWGLYTENEQRLNSRSLSGPAAKCLAAVAQWTP